VKRRHFLIRSAGAALCAAVPLGAAAALRGSLLDDPESWLGQTFRLPDGARLELARVERRALDRHATQWRLQFRKLAGDSPAEGMHALASTWREEQVFLQDGREGPVAWVNRLHATA
jgi:hypothetical protein